MLARQHRLPSCVADVLSPKGAPRHAMTVEGNRFRTFDDLEPGVEEAPAEVDVLGAGGKGGVEHTYLVEDISADRGCA